MGLRAAPGRLWPQGSERRAGPCQAAGVHDMLLSQKADTWSVTQPGALWFFFSFFFSVTTIQAFFLRDGPGLSRKPGPAVAAPAGGQPLGHVLRSSALEWSSGPESQQGTGGRGSRGHARPREGSRLAGRAAARSGRPATRRPRAGSPLTGGVACWDKMNAGSKHGINKRSVITVAVTAMVTFVEKMRSRLWLS